MISNNQAALYVALALGAGGALGYFLAKSSIEKKADERADAEIASAKETYEKLKENYRRKAEDEEMEAAMKQLPEDLGYTGEDAVIRESPAEATQLRVVSQNEEEDEDKYEEEHEDEVEDSKSNIFDGPQIVSEEQFDEAVEEEGYVLLEFVYFEPDEIVLDIRGEYVPDPALLMGNALALFEDSPTPDILYVLNRDTETAIQIDFSTSRAADYAGQG